MSTVVNGDMRYAWPHDPITPSTATTSSAALTKNYLAQSEIPAEVDDALRNEASSSITTQDSIDATERTSADNIFDEGFTSGMNNEARSEGQKSIPFTSSPVGMKTGHRDSWLSRPIQALQNMTPSVDDHIVIESLRQGSEGLSPLLLAARSGDVAEVNALLSQPSTNLLRCDPAFGQSALHFAVRGGHMSVLKALCAPQFASSIINLPDNHRNTALHLAAAKSRRITKLLLEHGADVHFLNARGHAPLGVYVITTQRDDPILAELLLRHEADPNAALDQSTLLHVALDRGFIEIALRLVRYGACLNTLDENKKMVFDKVEITLLKRLLANVNRPPVWINDKARPGCMCCDRKFSVIVRRHHCRYCGRLCCSDCASGKVAAYKFPKGFNNRLKKNGSVPNHKPQRVCNTCFGVLSHQQTEEGHEGLADVHYSPMEDFFARGLNVEWDEVKGQMNHSVVPQKLSDSSSK